MNREGYARMIRELFQYRMNWGGGAGIRESCLPAEIQVGYFRITNQIRQTLLLWQPSRLRDRNGLHGHLFQSKNGNA
jgi:hypothetical protein